MNVSPRLVVMAGLLALLPIGAYALTQPDTVSAVVTAINVILITGSLALAFRPAPGERVPG